MKTPTDTASTAAIRNATRKLRLPGIREQHTRLADHTERTGATYLGFLADALTLEVDDRAERRRVRYTTCAQLTNELNEAADERRLAKLIARADHWRS